LAFADETSGGVAWKNLDVRGLTAASSYSLHHRSADAKLASDLELAHTARQKLSDALFDRRACWGAAEPNALQARSLKASTDTFLNDAALELAEHAEHWNIARPDGVAVSSP
jgi:hypothetical protein